MVAIYQPGETIYIGRPRAGVRLAGGGGARQLTALYASLVGYWKLDEASGARADSIGSNTLTDNNTVASATGLVYALAGDFVAANSEYLSIADNAAVSVGDIDFWLSAWVYLGNKSAFRGIAGKYVSASNNIEYLLYYDSGADRFSFIVDADGTAAGQVTVTANTLGAPTLNTWYLLTAYHDAANNVIGIAGNAGAADTQAHATGVFNGAAPFEIGRHNTANYWQGRIGPVMLGKGPAPTLADRTLLYDAGAGLTLAQMAVT